MTPAHKIALLVGAVFALLAATSAVVAILRARARSVSAIAILDDLKVRMRSWWAMVAVFAVAFLLGRPATIALFACVSFLALREFLTLAPTRRADHSALCLAAYAILPLQYWLIAGDRRDLFAVFVPLSSFVLLPAVSAISGDSDRFLERTAAVFWGLMAAVYAISHVPAMLNLDLPGHRGENALLVFYLAFVAQLSDAFQYVFGKMFGRTKIAPAISPGKTIEGLIGGGAVAVAAGVALSPMTPFSVAQSAAMSAVIVAMGFLGGLVMSAVKRSLGVKDWGDLIRGHGGMLDRADSVVFSAPIFFHLTRYFFT